jgi:hypothetical protein
VGDMMIRVVLVLHVYIRECMYMGVLRILFTTFIVCFISCGLGYNKFFVGTLTTNA